MSLEPTGETLDAGVRAVKGSNLNYFILLTLVIAFAIVRSAIATSLDSFTYDEAYHVGAGAAYVKTGDFRLNPEQPPLTKLWVGAYVTLMGYNLSPYRAFADKEDERGFVEDDAYVNNDPVVLQTRARTAMLALNGLLLFCLALAVRRSFGDVVSLGAAAFLAIDPTVAAHMPVVMTDLPVGLASGTAVLIGASAFQRWAATDIVLAAVALGVALAAKHSGIITVVAVGLIGLGFVAAAAKRARIRTAFRRSAIVGAVVLGGIAVLWAFYGFRYDESPGAAEETFNRPLADKISDIRSPVFRNALVAANALHVFPRSYTWGMADTIRAGVEGRAIEVKAFGNTYYAKAPFYFFPGVIAAKLPIGLLLLSLIGIGLCASRRLPPEFVAPIFALAAFSIIFLGFLIRGSSYAGVRHALPLFPIMALLGGMSIYAASRSRSYTMRGAVGALLLAAIVSAVPQMRPWEYFNEIAGGAENGYLYFNDEGVDLSQRIGEAADFYRAELEPNGEVPFLAYFSNSRDRMARGMDWVGRLPERDLSRFDPETITGTFMIGANELGERGAWDIGKPFRNAQPVRRMGNLFVFKGTFERPNAMVARGVFYRTIYSKIYSNEPDIPGAIEGIERSLALDDSQYFVSLELGNQYLKIGDKEKALAAYRRSLERAPQSDSIHDLIAEQVRRLEAEPHEQIKALRNPGIE